MRLRKPCEEHDRYEPHNWQKPDGDYAACPGGEFLPEGALVIEKVDGEWPEWAWQAVSDEILRQFVDSDSPWMAGAVLDALVSQVGESE